MSDSSEATSPFLHGFIPPSYLSRLTDDSARALIRQDQLPVDRRPEIDEDVVEEIRLRCDNHPFLMQLVTKRFLDAGTLDEGFEQVAADPMVSHFFSFDVEMLSRTEQRILREISEQTSATSNTLAIRVGSQASKADLSSLLFRLENLGYLRRDGEASYRLMNHLFRRWMDSVGRQLTEDTVALPGHEPAQPRGNANPVHIADRYQVIEKIGEGATGIVYRALDRMLDAPVAVKMLKPEFSGNHSALKRLRQEILLSRDLGHPNIVRTYHLGDWQDRIYLTMQWIEGSNLKQLLKSQAPLELRTAIDICIPLASALGAAHEQQILHRDLKPENILMTAANVPKITDFGLARVIGEPGMTHSHMFVGTPNYTSPEQAEMRELDERSDIYALGLILFELTTGGRPFHAESAAGILMQHSQVPAPDPREFNAQIPQDLAAIILRCLQKLRSERFGSARELETALRSTRV